MMLNCDTCQRTKAHGVYCSGLGPVSFAYCVECLVNHAEPEFMFEFVYENIGTEVAKHVECSSTFKDGKYLTWREWLAKKTT